MKFSTEIASAVLQIVTALVSLLMSTLIIPWLKNTAIPWLKEKRLYGVVTKFVYAAEKLAETGAIDREAKNDYVVELLTNKGYIVDDEVRAFIESAVKELDMAIMNGFNIAEAIPMEDYEDDADEEGDS